MRQFYAENLLWLAINNYETTLVLLQEIVGLYLIDSRPLDDKYILNLIFLNKLLPGCDIK